MSSMPPPGVLLADLQRIVNQRASAGIGFPELGIPPPASSYIAQPLASDSALRRLLIEMLNIDAYGLSDETFHQTVRLELEVLLQARDRMRLHDAKNKQFASIDRARGSEAGGGAGAGRSQRAEEWPARSSTFYSPEPRAAGATINHTNSGNSQGTFTAVANVNKSFDLLLDRAWQYRRRTESVKEELLEHWEVLSGLMEESHVRVLLGLDDMPIGELYTVVDKLFSGSGQARPPPITRAHFETFFTARAMGLLGTAHLVHGSDLHGAPAPSPRSTAALSSVRELMDAERRLAQLPSASPPQRHAHGREASLYAGGGGGFGGFGGAGIASHLLAAMSASQASPAPSNAHGPACMHSNSSPRLGVTAESRPLSNPAQGQQTCTSGRANEGPESSRRLPWWAE